VVWRWGMVRGSGWWVMWSWARVAVVRGWAGVMVRSWAGVVVSRCRGWVVWGWFVVAWRGLVVAGLVDWWRWLLVSVFAVAFGSSHVVTGSDVFIEKGSIWAVECVLLSISMAQVVDLATGFFVGIESVIVSLPAVKRSVSLVSNDFHWSDFLGLVGFVIQKDWSLRLVRDMLWWPISWLWGGMTVRGLGMIMDRLRVTVSRFRVLVGRLRVTVSRFWVLIGRLRVTIGRFWVLICRLRVTIGRLWVFVGRLRVTISWLRVTISWLGMAISRLRVAVSRLRVAVSRLRVAISWLRVAISRLMMSVSGLMMSVGGFRVVTIWLMLWSIRTWAWWEAVVFRDWVVQAGSGS